MIANVFWVFFFIIDTNFGYGAYGHQLTGFIAQSLLKAPILEQLTAILPAGERSLEYASTWADRIKNPKLGYQWANHLHYVNAHDDPPLFCKNPVEMSDCPRNGCILSAVYNVTKILKNRSSRSPLEIQEALLFLIHFMGDLHQPMHIMSKKQGGNGISVKFDGKNSKLHQVWDTQMILKRIKSDFGGSKERYFESMKQRVFAGYWTDSLCKCNSLGKNALHPFDPNYLSLTTFTTIFRESMDDWFCPLEWASNLSAMNCNGTLAFEMQEDLGLGYYERYLPVVEQLLAQAGIRMAKLLTLIFQ